MHTPTPTPLVSPTPMAEASVGDAVITTGEPAGERTEVEQNLQRIERHLARINRNRLSTQDAADYDRIASFVTEAHTALNEHDSLRARSLTEKAARLASQLESRVSNQ